ncbi:unnamed protein product, partial [Ascophyllum nodosum]
MKNHQAGAGRDCKTRLEIPNSQNPSCGQLMVWFAKRDGRDIEGLLGKVWLRVAVT